MESVIVLLSLAHPIPHSKINNFDFTQYKTKDTQTNYYSNVFLR